MTPSKRIWPLLPNRVWRSYPGGAKLSELTSGHAGGKAAGLAGVDVGGDGHFPEDWILSTVRAVNPGRESVGEGPSRLSGPRGEVVLLPDLIARDAVGILGADAVAAHGQRIMLLVKYLDSAVRLQWQVHPTADFSRAHLGANSGKTEAYHILDIRPGSPGLIFLGFQRPPSRSELKRFIESQDLAALENCFDPITVKVGDTLLIPGGRPHAIGAGVLMVEVMEPTDFVVRFEFEKAGYTLPESARFMNRGLDFCLDIFDYSPVSAEEVRARHFFGPLPLATEGQSLRESLIDGRATKCFEITRTTLRGKWEREEGRYGVFLVLSGKGTISARGETHPFGPYDRFFLPANLGEYTLEGEATILECWPPGSFI